MAIMPTGGTGNAKAGADWLQLSSDVVAYSRHMHLDEQGTHARYKAHRIRGPGPALLIKAGR
jgi:hypothetical protein